MDRSKLSVVVPAYNENEVLIHFHERLSAVLESLNMGYEVLFVNDGSIDGTSEKLRTLQRQDRHVTVLELSRNFGKEIALTAGLDHAAGEAVIVIDADLQDPPELIPDLIKAWESGYDVVYAQRIARDGESWLKKLTAFAFYRLIDRLPRVRIPRDTGDYRLLSRRAVNAITGLREQHRFMKGLFAWIGYPQIAVPYHRDKRFAGHTKWNYWNLWNFALEGITSFTTVPLRVATYIGIVTAAGAFMYGLEVILKKWFFGNPVPGYPSLMAVILFLGGIQILGLGIVGEYLGRMFDETKNRPLYLISEYSPSQSAKGLPNTIGAEGSTEQCVGHGEPQR